MDRTRRLPASVLRGPVWRPAMGFHSESFRFEGGGSCIIGLNRTGKSCRLRWVNYLHPGLKRGKMTPQEERLVLELHAKWGNRWSRIARKLPGRTDNEIKNYWRTHMRKKAQEKKRANNSSSSQPPPSPSSSSSTNSMKSSSSSSNITTVESLPFPDSTTGVESFYDTGGHVVSALKGQKKAEHDEEKAGNKGHEEGEEKGTFYSMDDIWKEISLPEVNDISMEPFYGIKEGGYNDINGNNCNFCYPPDPLTTVWDDHQYYCSDSLWKMDEDASKAFFPTTNDQVFSCFGYEGSL